MADLTTISQRFSPANDTLDERAASRVLHRAPLRQPLVMRASTLFKAATPTWPQQLGFVVSPKPRSSIQSALHAPLCTLAGQEAARGRPIILLREEDEVSVLRLAKQLSFAVDIQALPAWGAELAQLFPQGFIYAGCDHDDLPYWAHAQSAVGVELLPNTAKALAAQGKAMLLLATPKPAGLMKARVMDLLARIR